jgi:hypothetical protein
MRFGEACDKANARSSQAKAYLGAIVVWLHAGDAQQAWQVGTDSSSSSSSARDCTRRKCKDNAAVAVLTCLDGDPATMAEYA